MSVEGRMQAVWYGVSAQKTVITIQADCELASYHHDAEM